MTGVRATKTHWQVSTWDSIVPWHLSHVHRYQHADTVMHQHTYQSNPHPHNPLGQMDPSENETMARRHLEYHMWQRFSHLVLRQKLSKRIHAPAPRIPDWPILVCLSFFLGVASVNGIHGRKKRKPQCQQNKSRSASRSLFHKTQNQERGKRKDTCGKVVLWNQPRECFGIEMITTKTKNATTAHALTANGNHHKIGLYLYTHNTHYN